MIKMTARVAKKTEKHRQTKVGVLLTSVGLVALIFSVAIFLSDEIADHLRRGLNMSATVIIPSVMPFLLLGDVCIRFIRLENSDTLRGIFERIFNVNGAALPVFVCGALCGFPVGARLAIEMYKSGKISKCECQRLISFANNASPGYIICAVGIGMRQSLFEGILLYSSMILSSVITGALIGINKSKSNNSDFISWQRYSFVESVKSSSLVCLYVSAFVSVFSVVVGLIDRLVGSVILKAVLIPFIEIGNAAAYLSDLCILSPSITLALTAFAVSFSGLCVGAQTLSLIDKECNISFVNYIPNKIIQGFIAAVITVIFSIIKGL
jgi:sporulation integral membrane protein YlbJ